MCKYMYFISNPQKNFAFFITCFHFSCSIQFPFIIPSLFHIQIPFYSSITRRSNSSFEYFE